MKKIILTTAVLASLTFFTSCTSDDNDTEKPSIQILTPATETGFALGDNINISLVLNDNDALKSFKIDIHENDGHNHGGRSAAAAPFSYQLIEDIAGGPKTFSKTVVVSIPSDVELTEYHLGIYAIDAAGNQQEKFIDFHIE